MSSEEHTKTAAMVDPQRDVDQYQDHSAAGSCQIKQVLLTHFPAGHIELRDQAGEKIYLGTRAATEFDF